MSYFFFLNRSPSLSLCTVFDPILSNIDEVFQTVNFPTRNPDCDCHSPALLDLFISSLVFVLQWLSLYWEILIMLLSQFPLTFHHIHNKMPYFIALLMASLVLIETVFMIIWEMFYWRISLNSVLLLLLVNLWMASGWNWCIYPSSIISGQALFISMVFSCLCCCHSS